MALPSAYIAAQEMHMGDSYFDYDPMLMAFWLGLLAFVALALHGMARWARSLPESTRASLSSIASWSAAAAQGQTIALAFGGGVDTEGIEVGLIFAAPVVVVVGLYYGILWLVRRFRKGRTPALHQAPEQVQEQAVTIAEQPTETVIVPTRLGQALAVAGTIAVFCFGVFAPDFVDDFYQWRPDVVHFFEANAFIPVVPLIIRSLMEIAIPVALVVAFRKRLLVLNAQKAVVAVSIAAMVAMGTFGSHISQGIPLIWMSADNAEEAIGDELKMELRAMAQQNPSRLCEYAKPRQEYSGSPSNYHFSYRDVPFSVFLNEYTPMVRELASQIGCAK